MGYIGPAVVKKLRASYTSATMIGLDIGYFAHCLTTDNILPECLLDAQYFGDIREIPKELLKEVDTIVHLAAISNDPMGNQFEKVTMDVNFNASIVLAKNAKEAGVGNFIYASSCSMYGAAEDIPRKEQSELNPLTAYAKSKVYSERELCSLASETFKVTSLRFATACGMSDRLRLDLVLNDFVAGAVASRKVTILSDGTPWRPLINIEDMARAIDWACKREIKSGGAFLAVNVGSDKWNYQVRDLAEAVADIVPGIDVSINKNAQPDKRSYKVDFSLFKSLAPDHQPRVDLRTTIYELKDGLEKMRFDDPEFRNSKFMRLKVLTDLRNRGLLTESLNWTHKLSENRKIEK
jgi:nucleoside-diphosphate-sugar epimerase